MVGPAGDPAYVNALPLLVPLGVVTVTSTDPVPGGTIALITPSVRTVKLVASVLPNFTLVAPVNPEPMSLTRAPGDAVGGWMRLIVGAGMTVASMKGDSKRRLHSPKDPGPPSVLGEVPQEGRPDG